MKRKFLISILIAGLVFITNGCSESDEEIEDLAKEAAVEFCNCFKKKSKEACLEELEEKYKRSDYMDNRFIEAFNESQTCDVELEKITIPN
jgi:hypothetical protein